MEDKQLTLPHILTLDGRSRLALTGAQEVVSFDDASVVLRTQLGMLVIHGQQLQLKSLSPQRGQVEVEGKISAMIYEEPRNRGGFWARLLG